MSFSVPVGISNRHLHLSTEDLCKLFGDGYDLTPVKDLSQTGQFAAKETVTLRTSKGELAGVRILGPERPQTQIEISLTDCFKLGLQAPVRESGQLDRTPGIELVGPFGSTTIASGVIIASRHIHMNEVDAQQYGIVNGQTVSVLSDGSRSLLFRNVVIRVRGDFVADFHIDTDEANAAGLKNGDMVRVIKEEIVIP